MSGEKPAVKKEERELTKEKLKLARACGIDVSLEIALTVTISCR